MSDKRLRYIIALAIAMLLIFQIGSLIAGIFGMAWGVISAVVVAVVSFFSARLAKAGGKGSLWFLLPTLVFTVIPSIPDGLARNERRCKLARPPDHANPVYCWLWRTDRVVARIL